MAVGTCAYSYSYSDSSAISPGFTNLDVNMTLSGAKLPSGASITSATLRFTCNVLRTDTGISISLAQNGSSTYSTVVSNVKFSSTGTGKQTDYTITLPAAIITSMTSGAAIKVRFAGGSQPAGSGSGDICRMTSGSSIALNVAYQAMSPCTAPTTANLSATIAEGNVTLTWSGAAAGTLNPITGYEIQYSDSANGSSWDAWQALRTVTTTANNGSASVAVPTTRGQYRRYQVRTLGSEGEASHSGWKVTGSVRKNTVPNPPATVTAAPETFVDESISVNWSGASGGTSSIKGYMIARRDSSDGGQTWSAWNVINTINLSASSGSMTVSLDTDIGVRSRFGVWTIDTLDVYSLECVSNTITRVQASAIEPPTTVTLSPTIAETSLTLSWSGAASVAGNYIVGYEIEQSESADGSTWGEWQAFAVVATTSAAGTQTGIPPPSIRGSYKRFRVRTQGSAGVSLYSDWVGSNIARRNTLPVAPLQFTAFPNTYYNISVTLSWSGSVAGTSEIQKYIIQHSTSTDGNNWTAYTLLATVQTSALSGSYVVTPSNVDGIYTRYRIAVVDVLEASSGYAVSNTIRRMSTPNTPVVISPAQGSITYNKTPRFLIQTGGVPDARVQKLSIRIGANPPVRQDGEWQDSVTNPDMFAPSGMYGNGEAVVFQASEQPTGGTAVVVRADNDAGSSVNVTRNITVLDSPLETISPNETRVKASHINTLRSMVNEARKFYGMSYVNWSATIHAGKTPIRDFPFHIQEIRQAVDAIISFVNGFEASGIFDIPQVDWLPIGYRRPRADVVVQLADAICSL